MPETSNNDDQPAVEHSKRVKEWAAEVEEKLKNMEASKWHKTAIFKVPAYIKNHNPTAYSLQMVSLGPYHHGEDHLKPMEEHKQRALLYYLRRSGKPLEVLYESLYKEVEDLKDSYDQLDDEWNKDQSKKFLELMILDGCFMLEIFLAPNIVTNLDSLYHHILEFFFGELGFEKFRLTIRPLKFLHVLDFHRHYLVFRCSPNSAGGIVRLGVTPFEGLISSAARLNEAGIQFEGLKEAGLGFGEGRIRFENGVLKLPVINIDDGTESMFLNMTAFERLYKRTGLTGMDGTSFILFMDNLVDNERDVAVLRSKGIIQNITGSDKAVAELFNSLSKDLILPPDGRIYDVRYKINEYCTKRWNEWRANLILTYFRNPWVTLSVIAAFLLFTLAILQTIYTVLPYYRK